MSKIKVLSVRQPWAWLICAGFKDVENRSWKTSYQGRLYIHAGKSFDWDAIGFCRYIGAPLFPLIKSPVTRRQLSHLGYSPRQFFSGT